ncbi:MAG TPA: FAD-dependent oxidoreductase, partial [Labilithrix sp.]|nr:FAD-dependent oxidoreductase [Labilithrix sp.]
MTKLVVIGNGMVGHRFCEKLALYDTTRRYQVTVLGEEPRPAYDRVHLTDYLSRRQGAPGAETPGTPDSNENHLQLGTADWYSSLGIELRISTKVDHIDRDTGHVVTDRGDRLPWDVIVIATGSAPFVPPVPGIGKQGVFVYRTIDDLEAIARWSATARKVAVIGGGLLGLEAARAMLDAGLETHVLEVSPRLMPRQLDAAGAALLETSIRNLGVHVHLGSRITAIGGAETVTHIDLAG